MELVSTYLYNRIPIETEHISNRTFHNMKRNGWYTDTRTNRKFTMLNKRIEINDQWYRVMTRFEYKGVNPHGEEEFTLSIPCPFIITECETISNNDKDTSGVTTIIAKWKDTKTYHGPRLKSVQGFFEAGVPVDLIDAVYEDLRKLVMYN